MGWFFVLFGLGFLFICLLRFLGGGVGFFFGVGCGGFSCGGGDIFVVFAVVVCLSVFSLYGFCSVF